MAQPDLPEQTAIHIRQWTYLPHTDYDVYLHGKPTVGTGSTMIISRGDDRDGPLAGWLVPPNCYLRKTRDYGVPEPVVAASLASWAAEQVFA